MTGVPVTDLAALGLKAALIVVAAMTLARVLAARSAAARHIVWTGALAALVLLPAAAPLAPALSIRILPERPAADSGLHAFIARDSASSRSRRVNPPDDRSTRSRASGCGAIAVAASSSCAANPAGAGSHVGEVLAAASAAGLSGALSSVEVVEPDHTAGQPPSGSLRTAMTGAWIAGALVVILRFIAALGAAERLVRRSIAIERPAWRQEIEDASRRLGLAGPPAVVASPDVSVPVTIGILQPAIVMPLDALDWPIDRIRVVLLHEAAHVRRRDALVQCLQHAACAAHWWNPFVWHAARRLAIERERACDDLVLGAGMPGPDYAAHLVDIARQALGSRPLAAAALAMARPSELEGRVMAMLDSGRTRGRVTRRMLSATAAGVLATAGMMASVRLEPRLSAAVLPLDVAEAQVAPVPRPAVQAAQPQPHAVAQPRPAAQPRTPDVPMAAAPVDPAVTVAPAIEGAVAGVQEGVRAGVAGGVQGGKPVVPAAKPTAAPGDEISDAVRESVTAALITALGDKNPDVRKQALFALSQTGSPKLVDPMLKALTDSDPEVRGQAAFALGQIDDPRSVPALSTALKDTEAEVRARAAFALAQIANESAIAALTAALSDKEPEVRAQVVFALGQIGGPKTVDALKTALGDADDDVRAQAASALGRILTK